MIVDELYYHDFYMGEGVPSTVFPRYSKRAEEAILRICGNPDFCSLSDDQKKAVTDAICAQIEFFTYNGISAASTGVTGQDYTIGKISVRGGGNSASTAKRGASMICPAAIAALEQTGLLNRAVPVAGYPMYTGFGWI